MLKKSIAVLPILTFLAFSTPAQAEELAYAFLEATATLDSQYEVEQQNIDEDADGYGIGFAWLMGPIAYSEWRYTNYDLGNSADGTIASARFGAHHRLNSYGYGKLDLYGGIGVQHAEFESAGGGQSFIDDTGLLGYIGLRHAINQHFEYGIEFGYHNVEKDGNLAEIHAQWNATHAVSFRLSYMDQNYQVLGPDVDLSAFTLAARVTFGQGG